MENWICAKDFKDIPIIDIFDDSVGYQTLPISPLENYHALFRKKLVLAAKHDETYTLRITADDSYKLYINGQFVGQGPACGYVSRYYCNEYDVSAFLQDGTNVIAVHCYYHGRVDYAHISGDNRQGMWAELYEGSVRIVKTDADWRCLRDTSYASNGASWGYDTQFAENIDRRKHPHGWTKTQYDDSAWEHACVKSDDDHVPVRQPTAVVTRYRVRPESIEKVGAGQYLLDFGKEITGHVCLETTAPEGTRVRIQCAEELTGDGHARSSMRCGVDFDEVWIMRGGTDSIESYDYSGFRYVEMTCDDASVRPEQVSVVVRHYPAPRKRIFTSENSLLQNIWSICENAVIMGTQEGFYDCPTREKAQYLGDMLITGFSHYYITGDTDMLKKALLDFAHSQRIDDAMMCVAPSGLRHKIADYSMLFPLILLNYYTITKNRDFVRQMIPAAEKVIAYYEQYKREDGLLQNVTEWNLVDWPENLRDGYDFKPEQGQKGVHNVMNAYYYGALKTMNELYHIVQIDRLYDAAAVKRAFYMAFYNETEGLFSDSEHGTLFALHSNVLPYFYDMTTSAQNQKIVDLIMKKGFSCGVFFSYFVLKSLTNHGEKEKAMELMLSKGEHSWYNMLSEGATACFEAWGKEQKDNTSLCHPWASAPIIVLCEDFGA